MENDFQYHVYTIYTLFNKGFAEAYREANQSKRRKLLPYVPSVHRRWYYSALIENTPFTPANVVDAMAAYHGEGTGIVPYPVQRNPAKFSGFGYKLVRYDGVHPVIEDLSALLTFCHPHVDIGAGDEFFPRELAAVSLLLTIQDPTYAAFLLEVALHMKLLTKMPSLYVNRIEPAKDREERLAAAPAALFGDVVNAAVRLCAHNLRTLIPLPEVLFTNGFVRAMLKEPIETDALFERVYDILGYTLEDLVALSMGPDGPDYDSEDGAFLAGTFMMGLALDRYFYTPFGYFLQIIKPHYVLPFEFDGEADDFLSVPEEAREDSAFSVFYAPCSSYTLTELGLRTLKVKPTEENFFDVEKHIPFALLKDSLFSDPDKIETLIKMAQLLPAAAPGCAMVPRKVYVFRVRMKNDPAMWVHLHVPPPLTLSELYEELLLYFPLRENGDFSFFHDAKENPFAEYPAPKRAKPQGKKTAAAALEALDFDRQNTMLMIAYNQALPFSGALPTITLELEMQGVKRAEPGIPYPCAMRMSKAMKLRTQEEPEL